VGVPIRKGGGKVTKKSDDFGCIREGWNNLAKVKRKKKRSPFFPGGKKEESYKRGRKNKGREASFRKKRGK